MRYTFLPLAEQQKIKREYRQRVLIVSLFFASVALVIGVGSLFPAYIYATLEEKLHLDQVAAFKKSVDAASIASNQKQLNSATALMSSLDQYAQKDLFYKTVSAIIAIKGSVKLDSFALDRSSQTTLAITIAGVAPTRQELTDFKSRLASLGPKVAVNLPYSTLAKKTDLSFSLQITETLQ